MDEWLSVGDAGFQRHAESRLQDIVTNAGILVLASHSPGLIERECNMLLELDHGIARGVRRLTGASSFSPESAFAG